MWILLAATIKVIYPITHHTFKQQRIPLTSQKIHIRFGHTTVVKQAQQLLCHDAHLKAYRMKERIDTYMYVSAVQQLLCYNAHLWKVMRKVTVDKCSALHRESSSCRRL